MPFACQDDSFLRELDVSVVSCTPADVPPGVKHSGDCYAVTFNDTVLFPEGGGQPDDKGTVNSIPVLRVLRQGSNAVHYLGQPLEVGCKVHQVVDWSRRFDHMQQHSGQHLLTAIIDCKYGYQTTSWWLGDTYCFIELDGFLGSDDLIKVEKEVNNLIIDNLDVVVEVYSQDDAGAQLARSRGLPGDWEGPVRVVKIKGVDESTCCGTHISRLGQLQVIKLLRSEKGKKGKCNVFFSVGDRVLKGFSECLKREAKLTSLLKGGPEEHCHLLTKIQQSNGMQAKKLTTLLKELAKIEAEKLNNSPKPSYFYEYRKEGNADYINSLLREINSDHSFIICLIVGDSQDNGMLVLDGPPDTILPLGSEICKLMEGKGAAKGSKFQGKVTKFKCIAEIEGMVKQAAQEQ